MKKIKIAYFTSLLMILCGINTVGIGQTLDIYQIKVSVGHATLIVYKNSAGIVQKSVLVDVGDSVEDAELIREVIHRRANHQLDRVYITHGDQDHWGGLGTRGKYADGLILKRKAATFSTDITAAAGSKITLKYTGAIKKDDGTSIAYPLDLGHNVSLGNRNMDASPQGLITNLNNAHQNNAWSVMDWQYNDADYYLGTAATDPVIITLAADCKLKNWAATDNTKLMNGCDASGGAGKNNRSGVLLIKWSDFTFLIQGDLQAAQSAPRNTTDPNGSPGSRIAATVQAYNPYQNPATQFPNYWEGNSSDQNAKTIKGTAYKKLVKDGAVSAGEPSTSGIVRDKIQGLLYSGESAYDPTKIAGYKRKRASDFKLDGDEIKPAFFAANNTTVNYLNKRTFIAWPDRGRWELAKLINSYNGNNGDGKVSVALVPHHGALTANLWFRTDHAIYGTPEHVSQSHPHPEFYCVRAVHNTVGATNMYFTYLTNDSAESGIAYNRLNYMSNMEFTPTVNYPMLNDEYDYFRVTVTNGGGIFNISRAKKDGANSGNITGDLMTSTQY